MFDQTFIQLLLVPTITGIVNAIKNIGLNDKYAPILAMILGGLSSLMFGYSPSNLMLGILAGFAAIGWYEFQKPKTEIEAPISTATTNDPDKQIVVEPARDSAREPVRAPMKKVIVR